MHTGRAKDRHFSVNNTSELRNRMSEKPRASLLGIQRFKVLVQPLADSRRKTAHVPQENTFNHQ